MTSSSGIAEFGITALGDLLYAPRSSDATARVYRTYRNGRTEVLVEAPRAYSSAIPAPDGRFLALWIEEANGTIFVHDMERGTSTRLVSGFDNQYLVWSPNGQRLAFRSNREGPFNLYWQAMDGSDEAERLTTSELRQNPTSWSPDGTVLAFNQYHPESGADIWVLSLDDERSPEPLLRTAFQEQWAVFSPDGRWLAYQSGESGQDEVYVQPYPLSGRKRRVSVDGGAIPQWNPKGGELFFLEGNRMMAVAIGAQLSAKELEVGAPRFLFETSVTFGNFGVMPDGESFVTVRYDEAVVPDHLVLVQNWTEELKRLD